MESAQKIAHVFAADILRVRGVACVYLGRSSHARTAFDGDGCDGWTGAGGKLEEPTDSNFPRSIRANGGSGGKTQNGCVSIRG